MTATTTTFDCGGVQIRAHCRHLATVVSIQGDITAGNIDVVVERVRRFILAHDPLVLDTCGVNSCAADAISLIAAVVDDCRTAGIEWTLVPGVAVAELLRASDYDEMIPIAGSVHDALHQFADVIDERRQVLLPLVRKTA